MSEIDLWRIWRNVPRIYGSDCHGAKCVITEDDVIKCAHCGRSVRTVVHL